ncbi:hypothetical protein A1D23_03905 [Chelonobacter oris]|uniref:DUF3413 domain-containing protein n=1 Tax=Chelonobacter oris TaxID=505317 RepID=UPI002448C9A0|nr:DUF3413 domain-containing protein [Chelonobacter oris]MDH2999249.1 hypothetical protein [Chelonobacter oris]
MLKIPRQYWEATSQKISWGHWFAFFNIICAIVIGSRYAFIADWPATLIGKIYFFLNILGHFSFIVFALYLLILFPLSFLIKNPYTFRAVSVVLSTLGLTLLLLDSEVFNRFHLHLSVLILNILINPDNGDLARNWERFFVPMPLIFLIVMLFSRWSWDKLRSLERQKWIHKAVYLLMFCFIASHLLYAWADAYFYRPVTVQKSNLPLSYPMTARTFLEKNQLLNRDSYQAQLVNSGRLDAPYLDYPKQPLHYGADQQNANILLINISGLRYDAVNGNDMPSLSSFREKTLDFQNNYSSGNSQNGALTGLFYGLNANYFDSLLSQRQGSVWIERMQQLHYRFGLFVTATKSPLYSRSLFKQQTTVFNNSNQQTTQQWLDWYRQHTVHSGQQPWFGYLQYDLLGVMSNYPAQDPEAQQQFYRRQLLEIDRQLSRILPHLTDNTVVIITADQGYSYRIDNNRNPNYFGRDRIQVPMLIALPNHAPEQIDHISSQMDLLPTLMQHLFAAENPLQDYTQGDDLLNSDGDRDNWIFVSNPRWNVIITANGEQYHIDSQGEYQKYSSEYQPLTSEKPPLALFLQVFNRERNFLLR